MLNANTKFIVRKYPGIGWGVLGWFFSQKQIHSCFYTRTISGVMYRIYILQVTGPPFSPVLNNTS